MEKKGNIYRDGYDFFFWEYEPQTKIKHFVFQEYFNKWVQILGKGYGLNYFDCYAGCGAYVEGDQIYYGSPILAAEVIAKNEDKLGRKVNLVLIEQNQDNVDNIRKVLVFRRIKIEPIVIQGDFDASINKILDEHKDNLKPTFFFIDPFGFSIKYGTLKRIMGINKSEIFLNFMFTQINRFLDEGKIEGRLNELFGCTDWKGLSDLSGQKRELGIIDLYKDQLKKIAKFVYPYPLSFPDKERTYYYLFHLTNHSLGCSIMKSAFAKFCDGHPEYRGPRQGEMTLFDLPEMKSDEIETFIMKQYKGQQKKYGNVRDEMIDSTVFLEKDIKEALKTMDNSKIGIQRNPELTKTGRKRSSIEENDVINFGE